MTTKEEHIIRQKQWFASELKKLIPNFTIDENNQHAVLKLFQYVFRYPEFEQPDKFNPKGLSLNKGIFIMGSYGTGKTQLMFAVQRILLLLVTAKEFRFRNSVVWQVGLDYVQNGPEALRSFNGDYFFDELGVRQQEEVSWMGNKVNIANVLIMDRYNKYTTNGTLTHFSTNLSSAELREYLEPRALDRLTEMCNLVVLTGESRRKNAVPHSKPIPQEEVQKAPEKEINILEFVRGVLSKGANIETYGSTRIYSIMQAQGYITHDNARYMKLYEKYRPLVISSTKHLLLTEASLSERSRLKTILTEAETDDCGDIHRKVCTELITQRAKQS